MIFTRIPHNAARARHRLTVGAAAKACLQILIDGFAKFAAVKNCQRDRTLEPFDIKPGHVCFVGAGPGDPELLTLKARRLLASADVVLHDRLVSQAILNCAGPQTRLVDVGKEGFGQSAAQDDINARLIAEARRGHRVVRLKGGDVAVFGRLDEELDAVVAADLDWDIVPGITSASAASAAVGQSLTSRNRNASLRLLTGHDMRGFADHDWKALAQPGEIAAIYMGKKAARYIQGRLLMHGAHPDTPVCIVENASCPNERIISTTIAALEPALTEARLRGPALLLYGLSPRTGASLCKSVINNLQIPATARREEAL